MPPEDDPVLEPLTKLIGSELPAYFASSKSASFALFVPHLTLTSDIKNVTEDPQKWLDSLHFPSSEGISVQFTELAKGNHWTKKLFLRTEKDPLRKLAASCRSAVEPYDDDTEAVLRWVEEEWDPHVSLV
jgi:2',3'-cyclic-nucleotide 3'-phosphodiesterase